MRKMKKTLLCACLAFAAGIIITLLGGGTAYASGSSASTAEKISLDTWYIDEMSTSGTDWFKFTSSGNKDSRYVVIFDTISHNPADDDLYTDYSAYYCQSGASTYKEISGKLFTLKTKTTTRLKFKIRLVDDDGDGDSTKSGSARYKFMVKEIKKSGTAIKGSNSENSPIKLQTGKWYDITTAYPNEEDIATCNNYFSFKTSSRNKSKYTVLIDVPNDNGRWKKTGIHVYADIYNNGYKEIASGGYFGDNTPAFYSGRFLSYSASSTQKLRMNFVIDNEKDTSDLHYRIYILEMPSIPVQQKIVSLKAGTKRFTVKCKKTSVTTRYQIAYKRTTSKTWKFATTKSVTKTIKSLAKGKKYNVKVRGQRYVNGKYHSGQWSPTKTVKVK